MRVGREGMVRAPLAIAVGALYTAARVLPNIGAHTLVLGDTVDYFASSRHPLLSHALWAGARPPLYPLLIKLLGHSHTLLAASQTAVAAAAWLALAWLAYTRLRSRAVASVAAIAILVLSLSSDVAQWDRVLLTESLAISLGVALFVAAVRFCEAPSAVRAAAVVLVALAWTLLRDSDGYMVTLLAVVLVVTAAFQRPRWKPFALVAAALLVVFALSAVSSSAGRRWEGPLKDVITIRALDDASRTQFLLAHGLPLTRAQIRSIAGHCVAPTATPGCVTFRDERFYTWISKRGRSVYSQWLASHPATALADPVRHSDQLLGHRLRVDYYSRYRSAIAGAAERVFFLRNQVAVLIEALLALGCALLAVVRKRSILAVGVVVALGSTYPHLFVVYTFGALETQRHALAASVILRFAIVLAVACALDSFTTPIARENR